MDAFLIGVIFFLVGFGVLFLLVLLIAEIHRELTTPRHLRVDKFGRKRKKTKGDTVNGLVDDDPLSTTETQELERMAILMSDKLCNRVLDIVQASLQQSQTQAYCLTMYAMENSKVFCAGTKTPSDVDLSK